VEFLIQETGITGSVPDSVCDLAGPDSYFIVSCETVACECCECYAGDDDE
jgi:hypothetical protein